MNLSAASKYLKISTYISDFKKVITELHLSNEDGTQLKRSVCKTQKFTKEYLLLKTRKNSLKTLTPATRTQML